jgi:hypothetical protein
VGQALLSYGLNLASIIPVYLEASPFGRGLYLKHEFAVVGHAELVAKHMAGPDGEDVQKIEVEGEERWRLMMPLMLRQGKE